MLLLRRGRWLRPDARDVALGYGPWGQAITYASGLLPDPFVRPGHLNDVVVVAQLVLRFSNQVGEEFSEEAGCEPSYLPPYSSDLKPIEGAFSKVKGLLRRAEARTREGLVEAMGRALDAVTPRDVHGYLGHCGYRAATDQ